RDQRSGSWPVLREGVDGFLGVPEGRAESRLPDGAVLDALLIAERDVCVSRLRLCSGRSAEDVLARPVVVDRTGDSRLVSVHEPESDFRDSAPGRLPGGPDSLRFLPVDRIGCPG